VVHTCHTPLESLNFSGSFSVKLYFLNQKILSINKFKKKVKKKNQKKIKKKIKMEVTGYAATVHGLVTYTKRTAEI
jgi:hypothetical protein